MSDSVVGQASGPGATLDPREVDAALIAGLFRRVKPLLFANFGALILLTVALWESADRRALIAWATVLGAWTLLRFGLARLYLARPRPIAEARRWTSLFAVGSGVAGLLWGGSVFLVAGAAEGAGDLMAAFVLAALSAAAIAGYSNSLAAFGAFIAPILVAYGAHLVQVDSDPSPMRAAFVAFWAALLWMMARHLNEGFREGLSLSLGNRHLAERLLVERDRAEGASKAKTRFLANMTHELRTPLNAIIGYSEMMGHQVFGPLGNPKYAEYAGDIRASGAHLLSIVERMLDVSALEAGTATLDEGRVDPAALVEEAVAGHRAVAAEAGQTLEVEADPDLPAVRADQGKLARMLADLIDNALRFGPEGGRVTVSVRAGAPGAGPVIAVADEGPGIPETERERAVTPFAGLQDRDPLQRTVVAREEGGPTRAGLGLPLVKLLADLHGAEVTIADARPAGARAPGQPPGTRVAITLPAERVLDDAPTTLAAAGAA
ncbi:MAG: HAMP domain-containing sensor histidine kinase [Azospirillaceae bacterium]